MHDHDDFGAAVYYNVYFCPWCGCKLPANPEPDDDALSRFHDEGNPNAPDEH